MLQVHETSLWTLLEAVAGTRRASRLLEAVEVPAALLVEDEGRVGRAVIAQALNLLLLEDVMKRVPMAEAYVRDAVREGRKLTFDHGALRTVAAPCGALPAGEEAITRVLKPLGYTLNGTYPLDRLGMTGRAYAHADFPEGIPQFFVSELHPERFSEAFQTAVQRVVSTSADPLPTWAKGLLVVLASEKELPTDQAIRLLPNLVACFDRQHDEPAMADYETLLAESKEMAWIATEGNAFNHATDRVEDVAAVADHQKRLGRPMKEALEVGSEGRVIQTAFRAAMVERLFVGEHGQLVARTVPGSFHEFITRHEEKPGQLDLRFDSSNAQAIFKMTAAAEC
jgi:hypothetical protein